MFDRIIVGLADRNGDKFSYDLSRSLLFRANSYCFGKGVFEGKAEPSLWLEGKFDFNEIVAFLQQTNQICALAQRNGQGWVFINDDSSLSYAGVLAQTEGQPKGDHSVFNGRYFILVS
ncbi:hypothetical protein D6783_02875 [Candidatus Woesearchaeota archaeon]|nr:MAG: hypothetical protein D6783_02875 [Candidatus Woesearchaeota archaeon]